MDRVLVQNEFVFQTGQKNRLLEIHGSPDSRYN